MPQDLLSRKPHTNPSRWVFLGLVSQMRQLRQGPSWVNGGEGHTWDWKLGPEPQTLLLTLGSCFLCFEKLRFL